LIAAGSSQEQPLPSDTEARLASFTELVATAIANTEARAEVAASRARIVAAADEERRRVVRDLHDGAQQRLVHTTITLKLAHRAWQNEEKDLPGLLTEALDHAQQATNEPRELAHGILPEVLTQGGLHAGVDALASQMPVPVEIGVSVGRLPAAVEATAYFVVAEALTNVAKHAGARRATVTARVEDGIVRSGCATTASEAPSPTEAGFSGWRTGSPPSAGSFGSRARPTAARSSPQTSPSPTSFPRPAGDCFCLDAIASTRLAQALACRASR
jgi:hypothetical protein